MRFILRLSVLTALLVTPALAAEHDVEPATYQPTLSALVTTFLQSKHYNQRVLDDALSSRWLHGYLETLDYNRMFFLQSDIERFMAWEHTLDDAASAESPDLDVAFEIHALYRQRVAERMAAAAVLLDQPIDFASQESFDLDRSDDPWPANEADANDLMRRQIKERVLRGVLRGETEESQKEVLRKRYHRLDKDVADSEPADVLEAWLGSLARSYDPHSDYFKPSTNDDFDISMSNSLEGIGATLRTEGEYTTVVSLVPGGPAQLGGDLNPGDRIVAVAQGDEEPVDVVDERIDKVVKLIRGAKGTEVRLTVIPVAAVDPSDTAIIRILRDEVILTANDAESKVIEVPGADGAPLKVGVIDVPSFYRDSEARRQGDPDFKSTTRDVKLLIEELKAQEVSGLVIDLRRNGGGSLDEAVELTGLFIPQGPVVQIADASGRAEVLYDRDRDVSWSGPLIVLTSPLSASASEILAGAIQDYGRGLVVGSAATHGKGTVQNVIGLDPWLRRFVRHPSEDDIAGALKVTTHKFYRVSGASTQLRGVQADVVLPSPWDGLDVHESDLDYAMEWDRVKPLEYGAFEDLTVTAERLQAKSAERIAHDPEFADLLEAIDHRRAADSVVSLNLAGRKAELDKIVREPELLDDDEAEEEGPDMVLDEAARIMSDWLTNPDMKAMVTPSRQQP